MTHILWKQPSGKILCEGVMQSGRCLVNVTRAAAYLFCLPLASCTYTSLLRSFVYHWLLYLDIWIVSAVGYIIAVIKGKLCYISCTVCRNCATPFFFSNCFLNCSNLLFFAIAALFMSCMCSPYFLCAVGEKKLFEKRKASEKEE